MHSSDLVKFTERHPCLFTISLITTVNSNDCGRFTLAFATALCAGDDSRTSTLKVQPSAMRGHLLQCLENGVTQPFPFEKLNRRRVAYWDMKNGKIRYLARAGVPKTKICWNVSNVPPNVYQGVG